MTTDDIDLLRRKAAAFDAIESRKVVVLKNNWSGVWWEVWDQKSRVYTKTALLDAIESALSVDRQTPKGTFGAEAE